MPLLSTLGFEIEDECIIFVTGSEPLNPQEWELYMAFIRKHWRPDGRPRSLAWADTSISATQRKQIAETSAFVKDQVFSAVVTSSTVVRGIVTAISWLGAKVRAFPPAEVERAVAYLDLPPEVHVRVLTRVRRMRLHFTKDLTG